MLKDLEKAIEAFDKLPRYWQRYSVYALKESFEEIVALMESGVTWEVIDPGRYTASFYIDVGNGRREGSSRREPDPRKRGLAKRKRLRK